MLVVGVGFGFQAVFAVCIVAKRGGQIGGKPCKNGALLVNVGVAVKQKSVRVFGCNGLRAVEHLFCRAVNNVVNHLNVFGAVKSAAGFDKAVNGQTVALVFVGARGGKTEAAIVKIVARNVKVDERAVDLTSVAGPKLHAVVGAANDVAAVELFGLRNIVVCLGGNGGVINLVKVAVFHRHSVAGSPVFNGVAQARVIVSPGFAESGLHRSANKEETAIFDHQIPGARRADAEFAGTAQVQVIKGQITNAAAKKDFLTARKLNRGKTLAGVAALGVKVKVAGLGVVVKREVVALQFLAGAQGEGFQLLVGAKTVFHVFQRQRLICRNGVNLFFVLGIGHLNLDAPSLAAVKNNAGNFVSPLNGSCKTIDVRSDLFPVFGSFCVHRAVNDRLCALAVGGEGHAVFGVDQRGISGAGRFVVNASAFNQNGRPLG